MEINRKNSLFFLSLLLLILIGFYLQRFEYFSWVYYFFNLLLIFSLLFIYFSFKNNFLILSGWLLILFLRVFHILLDRVHLFISPFFWLSNFIFALHFIGIFLLLFGVRREVK